MYDKLVKRLRNEAETERYLLPHSDNGTAVLLDEAADAIEELSKLNAEITKRELKLRMEKPRWIPVTERLPEQGKRYLVIRFDDVTKPQFNDMLWHDAHDLWWNRLYKGHYNVTHWMPLPEPPKEE